MLTAKRPSHPGRTGLRGVDIRPRLFNEFDQTALETQPLALKRIGRAALCADVADQMRRYKCQRILFETNPFWKAAHIAALEDKIVQRAAVALLNAI
jgi:hypothetical protein